MQPPGNQKIAYLLQPVVLRPLWVVVVITRPWVGNTRGCNNPLRGSDSWTLQLLGALKSSVCQAQPQHGTLVQGCRLRGRVCETPIRIQIHSNNARQSMVSWPKIARSGNGETGSYFRRFSHATGRYRQSHDVVTPDSMTCKHQSGAQIDPRHPS